MFNFNINNYLDNVAVTPKQMWEELNQATINDMWNDTTQIYIVEEQKAYPFEDKYKPYEAWVSTISDDLINTSKVYSDFVKILFKDINHKQNYKGQYYNISLDGEHKETYICYDRINKLTQLSDFKCVRCNNELTWIDEYGNILKLPCYLGTDITSTNNLINKDGIVPNARMIILVQANEFTKNIVVNQRFLFQNSTAFKVEEINDFMREQDTNGNVTCIKMYVSYSPILPTDNLELNICDYYNTNYTLKIDQDDISQVKNSNGRLTATIKNNDIIESGLEVEWISNDTSLVTIDKYGNYNIIGDNGSTTITCIMKNNKDIKDNINVTVVSVAPTNPKIIVNPNNIDLMRENQTIEFKCGVYIGGTLQTQDVDCTVSNVDDKCYNLTKSTEGYIVKINRRSSNLMVLTFSSENCTDVVMEIKLIGLL